MEKVIEMPYGYFDYSNPKLLRYKSKPIEATIEHIQSYFEVCKSLLEESDSPFVFLFDATDGKWLSSEARIALGKRTKELESLFGARQKKTLIVVPNSIIRMMLAGVNMVSKPAIPQLIFKKLDEALTAAEAEIDSWE